MIYTEPARAVDVNFAFDGPVVNYLIRFVFIFFLQTKFGYFSDFVYQYIEFFIVFVEQSFVVGSLHRSYIYAAMRILLRSFCVIFSPLNSVY